VQPCDAPTTLQDKTLRPNRLQTLVTFLRSNAHPIVGHADGNSINLCELIDTSTVLPQQVIQLIGHRGPLLGATFADFLLQLADKNYFQCLRSLMNTNSPNATPGGGVGTVSAPLPYALTGAQIRGSGDRGSAPALRLRSARRFTASFTNAPVAHGGLETG